MLHQRLELLHSRRVVPCATLTRMWGQWLMFTRVAKFTVRLSVGIAIGCLLAIPPGNAEGLSPFARVIGSWAGSGSLQLSNGNKERIRCRANYVSMTPEAMTLKLELKCASDTYNFQLASDINYSGGSISGLWSEAT